MPYVVAGLDRGGGVVEQGEVGFRDQPSSQLMLLDEIDHRIPIVGARHLEQNDGMHVALTGLNEGEELESLVQGSPATRQDGEGMRFLDEGQLPREEVLEVDGPVRIQKPVGYRLERQADVDPV